jgi:hypothetical protein
MIHPTNRAERRYLRERIINRRLAIRNRWWGESAERINTSILRYGPDWYTPPIRGRFAKWNLVCGCSHCKCANFYDRVDRDREQRLDDKFEWETGLESLQP